MQQRQLIQIDDTSVMCLFDSQAEADKNSKIWLPWYLYVNTPSFREIVATQLIFHSAQWVTFKYLPTSFIALTVIAFTSHRLSSAWCIIFFRKNLSWAPGSPWFRQAGVELIHPLFSLSSWFVLSPFQFSFPMLYKEEEMETLFFTKTGKIRGDGVSYFWGDSGWTLEENFSQWEQPAIWIISPRKW